MKTKTLFFWTVSFVSFTALTAPCLSQEHDSSESHDIKVGEYSLLLNAADDDEEALEEELAEQATVPLMMFHLSEKKLKSSEQPKEGEERSHSGDSATTDLDSKNHAMKQMELSTKQHHADGTAVDLSHIERKSSPETLKQELSQLQKEIGRVV